MASKFNALKSAYTFEKLTVSSTAVGLTSTKYDQRSTTNQPNIQAEFALVSVETDALRYRTDGTDPDATTGHKLEAGDELLLSGANDIQRFRAIRVTTDATIQVSYS